MGAIYFWRHGEVYEYTGSGDAQAVWESGFTNYFAVDTNCIEPSSRYGKYLKNGWRQYPLEKFPPKFRTHLLLLGVV